MAASAEGTSLVVGSHSVPNMLDGSLDFQICSVSPRISLTLKGKQGGTKEIPLANVLIASSDQAQSASPLSDKSFDEQVKVVISLSSRKIIVLDASSDNDVIILVYPTLCGTPLEGDSKKAIHSSV